MYERSSVIAVLSTLSIFMSMGLPALAQDEAAPQKEADKRAAGAVTASLPARSFLKQAFPEFKGKDAFTGQPIQSGKLPPHPALLIDFWASDNEACAAAVAQIEGVYQRFHKQGFEIIGVWVDGDAARAKAFVKAHKMRWLHLVEERGSRPPLAERCALRGVPMMYLLDSQGRVVWEGADAGALEAAVALQCHGKPPVDGANAPRPTGESGITPVASKMPKELKDAQRLESQRNYFAAERLYRAVVRQYPGSAAAKTAQDRIVKFQTDPKIAAGIEAEKQKRKKQQSANLGKNILRMARMLIQQEKYELAGKMLKRVMADYPDSPEAIESKAELEKIAKLETKKP